MLNDIRYALRTIGRRPALSATMVLTLALGIGATTAIFSLVKAVLLVPLPYHQPDRVVSVFSQFPTLGFDKFWLSPTEALEFQRYAKSFESLGAYRIDAVNLTGRDEPVRAPAASISANVFKVLGVQPELGRTFTAAEDVPNAEPVALLGHALWRRAFGSDPGIVGKRVLIDGVQRTILGVMPAGFDLQEQHVEVWLPLALGPPQPSERMSHFLSMIGRLRPEVSVEAARAEMAGILARWPQDLPELHTPDAKSHPLVIMPLLEDMAAGARPALRMLAAAVAFLLLIACVNVGNMLLVQAEARQQEISVRTALGADPRRLIRQFVTESVVLALAAGVLGLLLAVAGTRAILALNFESIPRAGEARVDGWSLVFALMVSLASGLLFGLAPAVHARAGSFFGFLKSGGQRATATASRQRLRRVLVMAEIALAMMLVIGSALLIRSFWSLQRVDPGFRADGALSFELSVSQTLFNDPPRMIAFYERLSSELSSLPGVEAVVGMTGPLPKRAVNANGMEFEGLAAGPAGQTHSVDYWQFVTGDYFKALAVPLVAGRAFLPSDTESSPGVVIINESLARQIWPGRNPLGLRLRSPGQPWLTVVGVARDVKQGGLDQKSGSEVYFLYRQAPQTVGFALSTLTYVVRTRTDPMSLAGPVRSRIADLDPTLAIEHLQPLEDAVFESTARPRFIAILVLLFAAVALILASVGTYSVLAYSVEQRTQEIGVRMALGAQVGNVLRMVMLQGAWMVLTGLGVGLLLSLLLSRLISSLLFGVDANDLVTYTVVALLLGGVALTACYLPARRAARVDPVTALHRG